MTPDFKWFADTLDGRCRGHLTGTDPKNIGTGSFSLWRSLYVDDAAFLVTNRNDAVRGSRLIVKHFRKFGLTVHSGKKDTDDGKVLKKSKTEFMYIPLDRDADEGILAEEECADIMITEDRFISACFIFKYLGSEMTADLRDDHDVTVRIIKAQKLFYAWRRGIFQNRDIPIEIRAKFYKAVVINTVLYGCETWALTSKHIRRLKSFHHKCLRSMLRISIMQKIRSSEIRERAGGMMDIEDMLTLRRARWLHKIAIMPADRGSKKIVRKLLAAWVTSADNPNERGVGSNREHRRPWQTVRHGYRSTLRRLGFVDADKRSKVQSNNVLRDWMTVARDRKRWGALVEEKLGLSEGDFTSLYKG